MSARRPLFNCIVAPLAAGPMSPADAKAMLDAYRAEVLAEQAAEADRLRADRDAFADRVDTLTAVAKSNKRNVQALTEELDTVGSRVTAARIAGLLEAAEIVGNDDDCECGGCDSCIPRALARLVRDRAYALARGEG